MFTRLVYPCHTVYKAYTFASFHSVFPLGKPGIKWAEYQPFLYIIIILNNLSDAILLFPVQKRESDLSPGATARTT